MTITTPHGLAYTANPEDSDKPLDERRLMSVEVDCPGPKCFECKSERFRAVHREFMRGNIKPPEDASWDPTSLMRWIREEAEKENEDV